MKLGSYGPGKDRDTMDGIFQKLSISNIRVHRIFAALNRTPPSSRVEILGGFQTNLKYLDAFDEVYTILRIEVRQSHDRVESGYIRMLKPSRSESISYIPREAGFCSNTRTQDIDKYGGEVRHRSDGTREIFQAGARSSCVWKRGK